MATVIAYDENGNTFEKQVNFYNSNDRSTLNPETLDEYNAIISFGGPVSYYMSTLFTGDHALQKRNTPLCVDAEGRNHKYSPVYINSEDILTLPEVQNYISKFSN